MKTILPFILMTLLLYAPLLHAAKPRSPVQVTIATVQPGLAPADIKPGDAVEFRITGMTVADAGELNLNVELQGGVSLLSGQTSWSGPVKKGEARTLLITVRAPKHGNGRILARISTPPTGGASFAAEAEYLIGQGALKKPAPQPEIKKDNKGRSIREHRI